MNAADVCSHHAHVCPREFYAHSVGHYLGMDVHDTALIGAQVR